MNFIRFKGEIGWAVAINSCLPTAEADEVQTNAAMGH